jgi:ribosomal protein S18 acetylase RimI-like enzyme
MAHTIFMRKTTADLILRPRRPSDDAFIYPLSDRIFGAFSRHPTGAMASMLSEGDSMVRVAERVRVVDPGDGRSRWGETPQTPWPGRSRWGETPQTPWPGRSDSRGPTPVGFYVLGLDRLARSFGPWERPAVARLNAIGVQPDLHGRGVGRFLLDDAVALAREEGAVSLTLMTAETNARARRLFVSAGFQRLLVLERAYARGQRGIVMIKAL